MLSKAKPVVWIASSHEDLVNFPTEVKKRIGQAIFAAQLGDKHPDAKVLQGFGGAGVLEITEDFDGDTYRGVYTVRFAGVVYVLHCFEKKSKHGIKTPKKEMDLIRERLRRAEDHYEREWRQGR